MTYITSFVWAQEGGWDVSTISEVIGLKNGWFVAVVGLLFVGYLMVRGNLVSRKTVETQLKIIQAALQSEQESRELWQKSAVELLQTSDIERENSRHMLTVVETTLKVVTELSNAREAIQSNTELE